jgi:Ion transport protein.
MLKALFLNSKFVLFLILLNALIIFTQEFKGVPPIFYVIDNLFTIAFVFELIVKIRCYGFQSFWKSRWNRFDFIIISIAFVGMCLELISTGELYSITFITSLRVLRIFKSFRLIKFIPNVKSIVNGVNEAIKASYIVVLAFLILIFTVSVFTCSIYKNIAPEYFENPVLSLYSIFRVFSIEGWYEIPDVIAERTSAGFAFFTKLYFVLILFGGGILGMSLINSIFVDAMVSDNNDDLKEEISKLTDKIESLSQEIKSLKSDYDRSL